jgi:hypothetical protein
LFFKVTSTTTFLFHKTTTVDLSKTTESGRKTTETLPTKKKLWKENNPKTPPRILKLHRQGCAQESCTARDITMWVHQRTRGMQNR